MRTCSFCGVFFQKNLHNCFVIVNYFSLQRQLQWESRVGQQQHKFSFCSSSFFAVGISAAVQKQEAGVGGILVNSLVLDVVKKTSQRLLNFKTFDQDLTLCGLKKTLGQLLIMRFPLLGQDRSLTLQRLC